MVKKILTSRWFQGLVSLVLIYFAFKKVNILDILADLKNVQLKWIILNIVYVFVINFVGSYRWSGLLFKKNNLRHTLDFTKATYAGSFYGLFFPTGVAADLIKWWPLKRKYPELTKVRLFSSVFLDRFIGLTAFVFSALFSSICAKLLGFPIPSYLFLLFGGIALGIVIGYIVVFRFDLEIIFCRFKKLAKFRDLASFLKSQSHSRIIKSIAISFMSEILWIMQVWLVSWAFGAGITIWSAFVFLPLIAIILILPISIAGFGAREQLYLFFFTGIATSNEKILMVSTFLGIIGIISALIGGLVSLTPDFKNIDKG